MIPSHDPSGAHIRNQMPPVLPLAFRVSTVGRNLALGTLVVPIGTAARTDRGADGEPHAYVSGADIVLQMYSASLGAWKSVTLS